MLNKLTVYTKSGQTSEMTSRKSLEELYENNKTIFDSCSDKTNIVLSDKESFTIIPKDNIAVIDIRKVSD